MFPALCNALFPLIVPVGCEALSVTRAPLSPDEEEINSEMPGCIINIQNENWHRFFFSPPAVIRIVIIKLSWNSSAWSRELHLSSRADAAGLAGTDFMNKQDFFF